MSIDSSLHHWEDLAACEWPGLLLGNGASRAVSGRFRYGSLLEVARTASDRLTDKSLQVFKSLDTQNFEAVLGGLLTASRVNAALGLDDGSVRETYCNVKHALIQAVRCVHPPWDCIDKSVFQRINTALREYRHVFSTNYDLLMYWSVMQDKAHFVDFFWHDDGLFDLADTAVHRENVTEVLYLHGALHLERSVSGQSKKRRWQPGENLLESFQTQDYSRLWLPLFISEGDYGEKVNAIARSDYLYFAYSKFREYKGPIVVFGHSLGEVDKHLVRPLNEPGRDIAVGIRQKQAALTRQEKARVMERLPDAQLEFFDATTHPLGDKNLRLGSEHTLKPGIDDD